MTTAPRMKFCILTIPAFLISATMSACSGASIDTDFCEHWSTNDGTGESVSWEPQENDRQIIDGKLGSDKTYICSEINLSGRITVVSFSEEKKRHYSHSYIRKNGELIFVEEEFFVSSH